MNHITIDLNDYRTAGSKVFTGRDRGVEVKRKSKINELEKSYDEIEIVIPEDIGSINPSFLEEFLLDVVTRLKADKFFQRFTFVNKGRYKINEDLDEAVDRILRTENALA